jgi:hypothetical protein
MTCAGQQPNGTGFETHKKRQEHVLGGPTHTLSNNR